MLAKLETRFKGRTMIRILQEAVKFPSMESAAAKMQMEKIKGYAASNESPGKVFQWLNLDNVGDNLLIDPLFSKWMQYVKDFNKKNPKERESVYLPIRLNYNPEPVKRMINVAMKTPSTVRVAKRMEWERSSVWLNEKHPPQHVFHFLDLEKAGDKTLASLNFKIWAKYLNDFNHRYPEEKTSMIDGLRANYGDTALLRMFEAAKKDPKTEQLAKKLESELVTNG